MEYSRRGLYCFYHKIINVHRKIKKMHLVSEGSHNQLVFQTRDHNQKQFNHFALLKHIDAETKWPLFSRRHFQVHFREWKCIHFDWNFNAVCSVNNIAALVQMIALHRPGDKQSSAPMLVYFVDAYMRHSASMIKPFEL